MLPLFCMFVANQLNMDNRKTNNVYLFIVHLLGFRSLVY